VNQIYSQSGEFNHLQTARIWITGPTGLKKLTHCLLDSGSQSSFIHTSLVDQLQLNVVDKRDVIITRFESTAPSFHSRRLLQFTLQGIWAKSTNSHGLRECAQLLASSDQSPQRKPLHGTRNLRLADPNDTFQDHPIEILIGTDHYWKLINDNPHYAFLPLVLLPSIFGWVLSGKTL